MYKDILVAVDVNDETSSKKTVDVAVACCRTFGARLHLLAVVPDFGMSIVSQYFPNDYAQKAVDGAVATLAAFKDANVPDDIEASDIIANGTVYDEILATAKKSTPISSCSARTGPISRIICWARTPRASCVTRRARSSWYATDPPPFGPSGRRAGRHGSILRRGSAMKRPPEVARRPVVPIAPTGATARSL